MYKILVRNRELEEDENSIAKYSFYSKDEENDFETSDITEALTLTNELLDMFLRKDILLVDQLKTNTEIVINKIETITIDSKYIGIINDGTNFKFYLDLSSLEKYTIVNINTAMFETIKTYLETLGLTDIKLENDFSITAKNNTGIPVEGRISVNDGLFVLYSRETGTSNYITSEFATVLEQKVPNTDNDEITEETKFVDIYFVDELDQPLEVDKVSLLYRGTNESDDFEFNNVKNINVTVKNTGNYLIIIEKQGYDFEPYYEKVFTGKTKDQDSLTIKLTQKVD